MATEYINPQWRLPNEKTGNNQGYSMVSYAASRRVEVSGLANDLSITDQLTVSGWMKPSIGQINKYAFGFIGAGGNNGFDFGFHGGTCGSYANFSSSAYAYTNVTFSYADGNWHHFVVSYNGSKHKIYIDGIFKAESSRTGNISFNSNGNFYMFNTATSNSSGATGELTDVCVFDNALSDGGVSVGSTATGQIAGLYASTNPMALSSPPQAYYPLGNSAHMGTNYLTPNGALQDYVFDNVLTSRIFTPINVSNLTNVTQAIWFKTSTNGQSQKIVFNTGQYGTFTLNLLGTDTIQIVVTVNPINQTYPSLTFNYADGKWHQYIMNYDGSHVKLYIDGVLKIKTARTGTLRNEPTFFTIIGNKQNLSSNAGAIGEYSNFIAYEHTLTDGGVSVGNTATGEIATLYNYGSPIQALANIPQSSNIKAWYKLDSTEVYNSSITDWEINNATAEYKNSSFVDGLVGQFTEYIQIGNYDALSGTQAGSWSFWYNTKSAAGRTTNCTWLNGIAEWVQPSGTVLRGNAEFTLYTSNGLQRTSVDGGFGTRIFLDTPIANYTNEWVHVVGTYDGSNLRVYVNGEQKGLVDRYGANIVDFPATGTITTGSIQVGGGSGVVYFLSARYSNLSVWNKTLTLSEVNEIYNSGQPKSLSSHTAVSNLVSWWTLNNFTTGLVDSIGGYNATLAGSDSDVLPGSVSRLNAESSGMSQSNLITSDLLTTSSYSPYALSFDGNDYIDCGDVPLEGVYTISFWINPAAAPITGSLYFLLDKGNGGSDISARVSQSDNNTVRFQIGSTNFSSTDTLTNNSWNNVILIANGSSSKIYINNGTATTDTLATAPNTTQSFFIATDNAQQAGYFFNGSISNVSIWDTALTSSQVREIYNEGLPSNLHNFSGTAPVAWWQLGSNSSWTSGVVTAWTVLDEIGSNDGTSNSMLENAIVDGVGTSGNGVSANMGSANNISGSSPNGEANSLSVNMTLANIAGGVN